MFTFNIYIMFSKLKLRIFGVKPKSDGGDLVPRGIKRSIVPQDYLDNCEHWDSHLYPNKVIVGSKETKVKAY